MKKLVAVYGTLKDGRGNNSVMGDSEFMFNAYVKIDKLSGGGFPIVKFPKENERANHLLHVEVYEVTDEATMRGIDRLEGYTEGRPATFYDRIEVAAWPLDGGEPVAVNVYEYVEDFEDVTKEKCSTILGPEDQTVYSW